MAKVAIEGKLIGMERDDDRGNEWTLLRIDDKLLGDIVARELTASHSSWDTDYGRVRITIEQIKEGATRIRSISGRAA